MPLHRQRGGVTQGADGAALDVLGHVVEQRQVQITALNRLVVRGLAMISGYTPTDAQHVAGRQSTGDAQAAESVSFACAYTGRKFTLPCPTLIITTGRIADDSLYHALIGRGDLGLETLVRIGDCLAPGLIADAVYAGHRFARQFGEAVSTSLLRRERPLTVRTMP